MIQIKSNFSDMCVIRNVNRRKKDLNLRNLNLDNSWWSVKENVDVEKFDFEKICV